MIEVSHSSKNLEKLPPGSLVYANIAKHYDQSQTNERKLTKNMKKQKESGENSSRFVMEVDANSCQKLVDNVNGGQVLRLTIPEGEGWDIYAIQKPSWHAVPNITCSST